MNNEIKIGRVVEFTAKGIGLPVCGTVIGFCDITIKGHTERHVIINTGVGHLYVKPEDVTVPLQN